VEFEITSLYRGPGGYVKVDAVEFNGQDGALFYYANPDPRKLHAVDTRGMQELEEGVGAVEAVADKLRFVVFHGAYDPVHAGADITEFAGAPDYPAIRAHLRRGAALDARIKRLWPRLRTVALFCGDRYGGSVEWPLFAEFGVVDEQCTIQLSEVTLGIIPGWNGVLNVLLKAGATNALYMGQTGNPVDARAMQRIGLAQLVVETPPAPDRRQTDPQQWLDVWAAHARECQELLLNAGLEVATQEAFDDTLAVEVLAGLEDLFDEVRRRTDPAPYRALRDEIAARAARFDPEADKDELKALGKEAAARVAQLGKPLAPLAVKSIAEYVQHWNAVGQAALLERFAEAGADESERCAALMDTPHRVAGVGAVLSKDVADKVPVFD
jgi:enoyl-CoA hydratase/carnithine racemase